MSADEQYEALMGSLGQLRRQLDWTDEMLEEGRRMQHDPLSHWEAKGYVVEKRYATRHRSELFYVMGIVNERNDRGEDVVMLLSKDEDHAIIMVRK